jgi:hypothetical protein
MTEADPAFDTVHPSGHILVRSCRGGYVHSVTLSEAAGYTPSAEVPTERDLDEAIEKLVAHELDRREVTEK